MDPKPDFRFTRKWTLVEHGTMSGSCQIGSRGRVADCTAVPELSRLGRYSIAYLKLFPGGAHNDGEARTSGAQTACQAT